MTDTDERSITPAISIRGVTKRFGDVTAVDDLTIDIREGEFLTLLGPSGCGKTTTMRMVAGFEEPDAGDILLRGEDVVGVPPNKRHVNMCFQNYALFPHMDVQQNIEYGLKLKKVGKDDRARKVEEMLVDRPARGVRAPSAGAALGRPAAAGRARAGARERARRVAARRAARRTGRQAPQADAAGAQADPARAEDHVRLRHPRPGRSAVDVRPDRGDERRASSSTSGRRARCTSGRRHRSSRTSSAC